MKTELFRLNHALFPEFAAGRINLAITARDSLSAQLSLRIDEGGSPLQSIIDFEHSARSGCVLQFQINEGEQEGELCWFCAGTSLTARIAVEQWVKLRFGYDAPLQRSWLSVDDSPELQHAVASNPFPQDLKVGLGHWLGGAGRAFSGEIKNLIVTSQQCKPHLRATFPAQGSEITVSF